MRDVRNGADVLAGRTPAQRTGVHLGGLRVATPAFLYDAARPSPQGPSLDADPQLEFVVRVG